MDFRNLILFRLCAYEVCRAADPNLSHYCLLQMPDGFGSGDVFPSSVSVARSVAAAFVEARVGSRG